jgi:hypothetical protein
MDRADYLNYLQELLRKHKIDFASEEEFRKKEKSEQNRDIGNEAAPLQTNI